MKLRTEWTKNYRLKDKRITVWQKASAPDELGQTRIYWKPYKILWAHYRQSSGAEIRNAAAVEQSETAHFTINYYDWFDETSYKVTYRGRVYDVERIDGYEDYRQELELTATWNRDQTETELYDIMHRVEGTE